MIPDTLAPLVVPIDSVQPYESNPREGDVGSIAVSLERNGQYRPIVVNKRDGQILAGNHTWKAARSLGWDGIAATFVDVDEETARRIVLVDNRSNDVASYDDDALAGLLESIVDELGVEGLVGTGFDGDDLDELLAGLGPEELPDALNDPDDVPEPPAEPVSKLGDVWLLGPHRVVCGDSSEPDVLDRVYGDVTVGAVLTDPPYGINLETDYGAVHHSGKAYRAVAGDDQPFDAGFLAAYFDHVAEQWWWGANYYRRTIPDPDLSGSWLVWDKRSEDADAMIGSGFELAWSRQKHKQDVLRYFWTNYTSRFNDGHARAHPTEKPVKMLAEILDRWAPDGCVVADPYGGSGSTLIAAARTGRVARLVELDPGYVDVICRRYQEHTGDLPVLEATGETHDFTQDG